MALRYVQEHVSLGSRRVRISFLTDYTQIYDGINHFNTPFNESSFWLDINANGHNVIISACRVHEHCCVTFNGGITLSSTAIYPLFVDGSAIIGSTVNIEGAGRPIMISRGKLIFKLGAILHFTNTQASGTGDVIHVVNGGLVTHVNTGAVNCSIVTDGNIGTNFLCDGSSSILRMSACTITQNSGTTTTKYILRKNAYFDTNNRGNDWLPGESVIVDNTSTYA